MVTYKYIFEIGMEMMGVIVYTITFIPLDSY